MIYKVLYQKDQIVNPRRETTQTLYLKADNLVAVSYTHLTLPTN